ncbi:MAG: response regulator [Candidatus Heimdallarchaeota archaeon]|nr:response regulator [Candidatus Heimdallarchaeota archaeon]
MKSDSITAPLDRMQHIVLLVSTLILLIFAAVSILLSIYTTVNYELFIVLATTLAIINVLLIRFEQYQLAKLNIVISFSLVIFISSFVQQSATLFILITFTLFTAAIFEFPRLVHAVYYTSVVLILIYLDLGVFTIEQTFVEGYTPALNNNVQVLAPMLLIAYIVALVFMKTYVRSLYKQQERYIQLLEAHESLISQAQLKSIQLLAGGIAHDFNNLLTTILGSISLMELDEQLSEDSRENLEDMYSAAENARNLASQLLNLVRPTTSLIQIITDVNDLIRSTVRFTLKGRTSLVEFELDENISPIQADRVQISQVLQNLVLNADEAMDDAGVITVRSSNILLPSKNPYALPQGQYILISVLDQGNGIPIETSDKIFNMFYSTNDDGSGIGLAISKNIVETHGGYINFTSNPDGTEFFIILPAQQVEIEAEEGEDETSSFDLSATIAIYDDNIDVIKILSRLLSSFQVTIISATNSDQFFKLINEQQVDIFILDMILPGDISGERMAKILTDRFDDPYLVLSSGYTSEFFFNDYKQYHFSNILRKPYSFKDVRRLLLEYSEYRDQITH